MNGIAFPLTPALSRREREKRSQFLGETTAVFCLRICEFYKHNQRLSPLPKGEGQGEGKAFENTLTKLFSSKAAE